MPSLGNAPDEQPKQKAAEAKSKPGCKTTETCAGVLRKLVGSPNRDWIGQAQAPEAYSDGTRLFAYRALRPKMTCAELARAVDETRAAIRGMQGETLGGSKALMGQVSSELRSERQSRCKATAKAQ